MRKEYSLNLNYSTSLGETYSAFMEGLKNRLFLANLCAACDRLYAPPRPFCDICCEPTHSPFEIEPEGTVVSYTVYHIKTRNLPDPPFVQGIIRIDGAANSFLHFIGGIPFSRPEELESLVQIGMRVGPVWAEERRGDITDIACFAPRRSE